MELIGGIPASRHSRARVARWRIANCAKDPQLTARWFPRSIYGFARHPEQVAASGPFHRMALRSKLSRLQASASEDPNRARAPIFFSLSTLRGTRVSRGGEDSADDEASFLDFRFGLRFAAGQSRLLPLSKARITAKSRPPRSAPWRERRHIRRFFTAARERFAAGWPKDAILFRRTFPVLPARSFPDRAACSVGWRRLVVWPGLIPTIVAKLARFGNHPHECKRPRGEFVPSQSASACSTGEITLSGPGRGKRLWLLYPERCATWPARPLSSHSSSCGNLDGRIPGRRKSSVSPRSLLCDDDKFVRTAASASNFSAGMSGLGRSSSDISELVSYPRPPGQGCAEVA